MGQGECSGIHRPRYVLSLFPSVPSHADGKLADIAAVSVDQARHRHATSRGARFTAEFFALDCYSTLLSDALPPNLLSTPFDVVSMQFCMHYAFESEEKARTMLRNVATWLRPSGMFIGTIPNAQQLMYVLNSSASGLAVL